MLIKTKVTSIDKPTTWWILLLTSTHYLTCFVPWWCFQEPRGLSLNSHQNLPSTMFESMFLDCGMKPKHPQETGLSPSKASVLPHYYELIFSEKSLFCLSSEIFSSEGTAGFNMCSVNMFVLFCIFVGLCVYATLQFTFMWQSLQLFLPRKTQKTMIVTIFGNIVHADPPNTHTLQLY